MVGLRQAATRPPPIAAKSLENMSMKLFGCISLMSAPAANAFSLPVIRMQPILSSASRSSTAAAISANTPNDSALSIFGRFSVMTPTAPLLSTMMYSNVAMIHPGIDFAGNVPAGGMGIKWGQDSGSIVSRTRCSVLYGAPLSRDLRLRFGPRLSVASHRTMLRIAGNALRRVRGPGPSGHEHARGGGHRQQGAEGDEDLADQRGLIPGVAVIGCRLYGRGRGGSDHGQGYGLLLGRR